MIELVYEYNQHFVAMMNVINAARLNPPESGHKHHIIPKCYYKMNNMKIDDSESNKVLLSVSDHQKIHKLIVLCVKDPILRSRMGFAVHRLGGRLPGQIHHSEHAKELLKKAATGNKNCLGKKWTAEERKRSSEAHKGQVPVNKGKPVSDFGKKFFEKFKIHSNDNAKLYGYHYLWYKRHNNTCKWEAK